MGGAGGGFTWLAPGKIKFRILVMPINLTRIAKKLRRNSTDAERLLWRHLRAKQIVGLKFRRQEQIGSFIVDFVCYQTRVIVEADGGQHALESVDVERTQWLNSQGFAVLRFWNDEILTNIEGVIDVVLMQCDKDANCPPLPNPLPQGERE
jgi:very-short-patch-repair endonuclease